MALKRATFPILGICVACGPDAVHESILLGTPTEGDASPSQTASWAIDSTDLLAGPLTLQMPRLSADTQILMVVSPKEGDLLEVGVSHHGGSLVADGTEIPADTWIALDGRVDYGRMRVVASAEEAGHVLTFDGDLIPPGSGIEASAYALQGYFVIDSEPPVWVALMYEGVWDGTVE